MIIVSVSYNYSPTFTSPESWYKRTKGYAGVLEGLSKNNTVFNVKQINYEGNGLHNGVQYRFVDFGKKKTYFPWQLNRFVKSLNPDVVMVQGLHHPLQLMQLRFILNKKTKIIAQHHAEKPFTGIKKYIQQMADKCVNAYLFASHDMGIDWVKKGNFSSPQKIHEVMEVSSLFYPTDKSEAKLKTGATGSPVFLWVGRLNDNKDPLNVVKAFLKFAQTNQSARLYMIYHTDELLADIKNLLQPYHDKQAVTLVGQLTHGELLYWYNSADFFISGSYYEGSGTAVCEAISCGCIPIVTDIFSFRMITDNGNCGVLYEAGNEKELLTTLLNTGNLNKEELRNKALAYFKANLSFTAIAKRVEQIAANL